MLNRIRVYYCAVIATMLTHALVTVHLLILHLSSAHILDDAADVWPHSSQLVVNNQQPVCRQCAAYTFKHIRDKPTDLALVAFDLSIIIAVPKYCNIYTGKY